jgi:MFS transporter, DHA1 family, multidrug resistance protein
MAMIGPFSIDTYIPAFHAMEVDLQSDPIVMAQTLTVYFFALALMSLFHGAISDSTGRRPVIITSLAIYCVASMGCALAPNSQVLLAFRLLQGLTAGAGFVVGRAMIRDAFQGADAQRMQSQITLVFGIAPAIAPIVGGYLVAYFGWRSIFVFMTLVALGTIAGVLMLLPETHPPSKRQPLSVASLNRNYFRIFLTPQFQFLAGGIAFTFAGLMLYIAAAPAFVMTHLKLPETAFAWLFMPFIFGLMTSALISGRLAGRITLVRQMAIGLSIAGLGCVANVTYCALFSPAVPWSILPLYVYGLGLGLFSSANTLRLLDLFPTLRGTCSSLMSFCQTMLSAIVVGVVVPRVSGSVLSLALTASVLFVIGLASWSVFQRWYRTAQPLQD